MDKNYIKCSIAFYLGLLWSLFALYFTRSQENIVILLCFVAVGLYRIRKKSVKKWGTVQTHNKIPLPQAIVLLRYANNLKISPRKIVTDKWGRYNFLVNSGKYILAVEILRDETTQRVYESNTITIKKKYSSIGKNIILPAFSSYIY